MSYLFKDIDSQNIKYVGFDLDGTLYDEFDFIVQPYKEIAALLLKNAFPYMCNRWLEKGSSYPLIFDEAYDLFNADPNLKKEAFIKQALSIFREFKPVLTLSNRVRESLQELMGKYVLFVVTDGNPLLQKRKLESLGLSKFFDESNIVYTGAHGQGFEKPNVESLALLSIDPKKAIFYGDRDSDHQFANTAKMKFQKVYHLIKVSTC